MSKAKINWILILQAWAMMWVVIGHAPLGEVGAGPAWESALFHFAYSFHMQLFILISGYLFHYTRISASSQWSYPRVIKDKAIRLLIPLVFFTALAYLTKLIFASEMAREVDLSFSGIARALMFPGESPLAEMWFIVTIFAFFLLMHVWKSALKNLTCTIITGVVVLILHFWHPSTEFLAIREICFYAVFFYLGILFSHHDLFERIRSKYSALMFLAGVGLYIVGRIYVFFLAELGGIFLSIGLASLLDKFVPWVFKGFRNYTYQIFLMGIFVQIAVKIAYRHLDLPYLLAFALSVLMGIYVPVIITIFLKRLNIAPLLYCIGLKPATNSIS